MKHLLRWAATLSLALTLLTAPAFAQSTGSSVVFPAGYAPGGSICTQMADGTCVPVSNAVPLPTIGKQESFALMTADVAVLSATVAGGDYAFSQTCTTYGTLSLQVLGPDGVNYQTLASKTASDTAGATGFSLGSFATVRVTTTGATGCYAILARIPA